ncbi:hypothetical protein AQUCO_00800260v1 [Aquilegia coerulea]|uniref:Uncharacterized protein n=1 Tax=Aquilegia coerulea TaxID=218851 RepID=A0A2G5EHX4_AQUCA|nr:hypothetical protein AQUCO_00800260v1 [Aquilegia coerulea]
MYFNEEESPNARAKSIYLLVVQCCKSTLFLSPQLICVKVTSIFLEFIGILKSFFVDFASPHLKVLL